MTNPAPASLLRLLLCGMLLVAPGAMGQTTPGGKPPPTKQKPTPVVQPHGALHPQKPPSMPPVAALPVPPIPVPPPGPIEPLKPAEADTAKGSNTGLPLPRFAALRSDEVNLRAGPGTRYPIDWIYKRRELPVEIQREFEVWRLVQDPDGTKGWVHQATLTGRRSFIVTGGDATLRRDAQDSAAAVAILKLGVIGHIRSCVAASDWCQVQAGDYRGYLKRSQFWGTLPAEVVAN
ncbi:MAG TPA: SH3 domain-containing protein [Acetobacteraceae bacterium]|nr:SH3 domain-containing protein [Acetobacteraceae bacterium]